MALADIRTAEVGSAPYLPLHATRAVPAPRPGPALHQVPRCALLRARHADALVPALPPLVSLGRERLAEQPAPDETVDVEGAAALLKTTVRAIYERRRAGSMPTPITRRPLV